MRRQGLVSAPHNWRAIWAVSGRTWSPSRSSITAFSPGSIGFVLDVGVELLLLAQFLLARTFTHRQRDAAGFAVADQFDRNGRARRDVGHEEGQGLVGRDILPVDLGDDIAGADARLLGGFAGLDRPG